ncbi:MAG: hypothetical protein PHD00_05845 [Bacteroidales bacterium]|nr:hypothetical protein [Bacteroidales bacterium]MDD4672269.1 hypothetical protein [Bacteroidales bacterium]
MITALPHTNGYRAGVPSAPFKKQRDEIPKKGIMFVLDFECVTLQQPKMKNIHQEAMKHP